ncbi:unnamed protein product [Rodentolepis nana]|uniref:Sm domain-containing protein n=1 Tax=Rodentolepis nana TaxID=102285 RepID=A0A0R3TKB7_RODNA|nr:unnamed protein product [Rodentolepis nana]
MACASPTLPNTVSENPQSSFLLNLMGKRMVVKIVDGRIFDGLLMCTDNCGNIAMRDVIEFQPKDEDNAEINTRKLYLITIRGEFIKQICIAKMDKAKSEYNIRLIFGVVSLYWVVSISLVFINKWLLSNSDTLLDAPMFVTWFQCFITVLLCVILAKISSTIPDKFSFPNLDFSWKTSLTVMPLSCVFFLMIFFNNLCLKYLDVAFYFVARSLTTVFNVILTYLILRKTTSLKAIICCAIIIAGYMVSVIQENGLGTLSLSGLFYGLSASLAVSLFSILTSKGLALVDGSVWRLTFYNNLNSFLLFIIGIAVSGEWKELHYLPTTFRYYFQYYMKTNMLF